MGERLAFARGPFCTGFVHLASMLIGYPVATNPAHEKTPAAIDTATTGVM